MDLKPGSRWRSAVSETEVVVVRAPKIAVILQCGGEPMLTMSGANPPARTTLAAQNASLLGKRYADEESGLELLCSRGGAGQLCANGRPLIVREAKKLPSSD